MIKPRRFLGRTYTVYLRTQLESRNPTRIKKTLQELCECYRHGQCVQPDMVSGLETLINGLLFSTEDPKVTRWALNALARIGTAFSEHSIIQSLSIYHEDPDIVAAAIAALHKVSQVPELKLQRLGLDPQLSTLAALQHISASKLDLSALPLKVHTAPESSIRLGLVIVGLNKAPENLFDPKYSNAELVRVLGGHHDPTVSQYSIWAITENDDLSINDLGIRLDSIASHPPNIRGWLYQLATSSAGGDRRYLDYMETGIRETNIDARFGVALGLKSAYSSDIEERVLPWVMTEQDGEIRRQLVTHIIRNSANSTQYSSLAVELYEAEQNGSIRENMLEEAQGTDLYIALKTSDARKGDLFTKGGIMANTYNIQNVQAGAVSFGSGDASNIGGNVGNFNQATAQMLMQHLVDAESEIKNSPVSAAEKKTVLDSIAAAKKKPEKGIIEQAVQALKSFTKLAGVVAGAETAVHKAIAAYSSVAGSGM